MLKELDVRDDAPWKRRYRADGILWARIAHNRPERGVVCSNRDGVLQLYAWHVASGELVQVTDEPTGILLGIISADGNYIYYHQDEGGNEIGHYVRVPFARGDADGLGQLRQDLRTRFAMLGSR